MLVESDYINEQAGVSASDQAGCESRYIHAGTNLQAESPQTTRESRTSARQYQPELLPDRCARHGPPASNLRRPKETLCRFPWWYLDAIGGRQQHRLASNCRY